MAGMYIHLSTSSYVRFLICLFPTVIAFENRYDPAITLMKVDYYMNESHCKLYSVLSLEIFKKNKVLNKS